MNNKFYSELGTKSIGDNALVAITHYDSRKKIGGKRYYVKVSRKLNL